MHDWGLLVTVLVAPSVAQISKIPFSPLKNKPGNWKVALRSGGMPSSHTALMVGLASACLYRYGVTSPYFAISTALSLVVVYDAMGVRRQSGEQAIAINEIISSLETVLASGTEEVAVCKQQRKLQEVLGHKPKEVLGGILVGILTATLVRFI